MESHTGAGAHREPVFATGAAGSGGIWQGRNLIEAWHWLEGGASLPTQTMAFYTALSATLLAGSEIELVKASDDLGIRGILPLCRDRKPFARWRMVGAREVFEPIDALCLDDRGREAIARQIADQARPVTFDRVPQDSAFIPRMQAAMQGRGLVRLRAAQGCPFIALDERWQEPEAQYNAGRRSDFRRAMRRASDLGEVTFTVLSPRRDQFDALFDEAIAVELRSWKKEAGTAIAADRAKEMFFRDFLRSAACDGILRLAFMRIDGRAVAMQIALEWHGRFWLFKIGFDEDYARCSPGTLLMLHTIGWAASEGLTSYEMLGNVEPWIAEFWTTECHPCVCLRTYPANLAGLVALAVDGVGGVAGKLRHLARRIINA